MKRTRLLLAAGALATAGLLWAACETQPIGPGVRKRALAATATGVIAPMHEAFAQATNAQLAAVTAFVAAPSPTTFAAAQAAWKTAHTAWKTADAFLYGPTVGRDKTLRIDFSVRIDDRVDSTLVEKEIAGTAALTPTYVAQSGTSRIGFHALEYVLFDGGDAALGKLTGEETPAVRRRQYAVGLAQAIHDVAEQLLASWTAKPDGYADLLATPSPANPSYMTIKASVDELLGGFVHVCDRLLIERIGEPLGNKTAGDPRPNNQESRYADHSVADMTASLDGLARAYATPDNAGLTQVVVQINAALDARVRAELVRARSAVAAIPLPFAEAVRTHRADVQAAYDAVAELRRALGSDVQTALGANLAPVDTDQD